MSYTTGRLHLDATLEADDRTSRQDTRGRFDKWNLDIARVQATPIADLSLFGRVSAQWAGKNLDSSEGFNLGGPSGVRAYPVGEGGGDEGWLAQFEARYALGAFSPYAFYDVGRSTLNADNGRLVAPANPNHRSIAGAGLGVRYSDKEWNAEASLAWRTHGGTPLSDSKDSDPRLWFSASYRF